MKKILEDVLSALPTIIGDNELVIDVWDGDKWLRVTGITNLSINITGSQVKLELEAEQY